MRPLMTHRPYAGDLDYQRIRTFLQSAPLVALHHLAQPGPALTVATYRAMMEAPTYCRELNLIVCAPDATFAAFCSLWYDDMNGAGLFEPVGCHPAHRRKGLATAMMREGLWRL